MLSQREEVDGVWKDTMGVDEDWPWACCRWRDDGGRVRGVLLRTTSGHDVKPGIEEIFYN